MRTKKSANKFALPEHRLKKLTTSETVKELQKDEAILNPLAAHVRYHKEPPNFRFANGMQQLKHNPK